jgi:3-isopropylmalate dehydratase small subunit
LLLIVLNEKIVDEMFEIVENQLDCQFEVDLSSQIVKICADANDRNSMTHNGFSHEFYFELDEFGFTLSNAMDITAYKNRVK